MNKRIIVVGDIHGRRSWEALKSHQFDRMIFVGDYFDNFERTLYQAQIDNFKNIIEFKKENKGKVVMLIGNHDYHYIQRGEMYSGYQIHGALDIEKVIEDNLEHLQVCHREDVDYESYLFSHAGFTKYWCKYNNIDMTNLEESVNGLFKENQEAFTFFGLNSYGDDTTQGPFWVRPRSLEKDSIEGYTQVVGHTEYRHIIDNGNFIYVDAPTQYLVIETLERKGKDYEKLGVSLSKK